eukprot:gnl/TRDRNA2_/TRDRNA2_174389_c0_seq1.p3 gnl/TRDRNA2_/TRDRNA2_174389_c0~~gnl/TRDRNA2_/TRDRNA2_174389_c0_seq1.p3  ORF type:complete len:154 (+),score=11.41 gnl/TRDRNA2_/TRDRNA2_174389_c0_seq1:591-1052(+)
MRKKICADSIYNKDFLYQAKSITLPRENNFDTWYCLNNGWLEKDIVALQHDFEAMNAKQKHLCETKYAKYDIKSMTFRRMLKAYTCDHSALPGNCKPNKTQAEVLGAWNCAMGNAGCDMAYCAYSFCDKGDGSIGRYEECPGWHPINGMPIPK